MRGVVMNALWHNIREEDKAHQRLKQEGTCVHAWQQLMNNLFGASSPLSLMPSFIHSSIHPSMQGSIPLSLPACRASTQSAAPKATPPTRIRQTNRACLLLPSPLLQQQHRCHTTPDALLFSACFFQEPSKKRASKRKLSKFFVL
jgi:hypothetical protein